MPDWYMRKQLEEDLKRLKDMLYAARVASEFVANTELAKVEQNVVLQAGLSKFIQDIGEAANKVSTEYKANNPRIPWRDAIDMRNFLVHVYSEIDFGVVWDTAVNDLPPLITELEKILEEDSNT